MKKRVGLRGDVPSEAENLKKHRANLGVNDEDVFEVMLAEMQRGNAYSGGAPPERRRRRLLMLDDDLLDLLDFEDE